MQAEADYKAEQIQEPLPFALQSSHKVAMPGAWNPMKSASAIRMWPLNRARSSATTKTTGAITKRKAKTAILVTVSAPAGWYSQIG